MYPLIHQHETFAQVGPITADDLRSFEALIDAELAKLDELGTHGPTIRLHQVSFKSGKSLRADRFEDLLVDTRIEHEEVHEIETNIGKAGIRVRIDWDCNQYKNTQSIRIATSPDGNEYTIGLFQHLRNWASKLARNKDRIAIRAKADNMLPALDGMLTGAGSVLGPIALVGGLYHHYWYGEFFICVSLVGFITLHYIRKLSQARFDGIAIGAGAEKIRNRESFVQKYYEGVPNYVYAMVILPIVAILFEVLAKQLGML